MAKENRKKPVPRRDRKDHETRVIGRTSKGVLREILFPTEPTSIDPGRIDRAIELVMSRRK